MSTSTPDPVRRAFVHVGAPKTGTTYLQGVLWKNRESLLAAGVHVLGENRNDHYRAGHDLRDIPFNPADPRVDWTGAWDIMCQLASSSTAPSVVISDEHLASLSPEQVRRAVVGLAPREVHVIYASRGLAGLLPSEWQEYVKHGSKFDYSTWARKVLTTPRKGPGRWFWSVHDPVGVVQRWSSEVPLTHIHVITMPAPSAGPDELWHRFARILGVDPAVATEFDVAGNVSLGVAETEVLRRVNEQLPTDFPRWHYIALTRDLLAVKILGANSSKSRPELPDDLEEVVIRRTKRAIKGLRDSGCEIIGDLSELRPVQASRPASSTVTPDDLIDTSTQAIAELLVVMARRRDEKRSHQPGVRERLQTAPRVRQIRGRLLALQSGSGFTASLARRLHVFRSDHKDSSA